MRTDKFDNTKESYESDDIKYAFECNNLSSKLDDIDVIVAEVCGANDEDHWYWILQLKDGTFTWVSGWCDYTGWDCQSGVETGNKVQTPQQAVEELIVSDYDDRKVKPVLLAQLDEEVPFAVYQEDGIEKYIKKYDL